MNGFKNYFRSVLNMQALSITAFRDLAQTDAIVLDTRATEQVLSGTIKGAVVIPFSENFVADLQGAVSPQTLLVITDESNRPAVLKQLKNSGNFEVSGYLDATFQDWQNAGFETDFIIAIEPDEFAMDYQYDEFVLADLRTKEEYDQEHIEDAVNISLSDLETLLADLEEEQTYYLYAATADAALTAGSLFKQAEFERVRVVLASYEDIKKQNIPLFTQKKKDSKSGFSTN